MLSKANIIEIECPRCKQHIKCVVGVEYDGDESGVWSYLAVEYEGAGYNDDDEFVCPTGCKLESEEVEEIDRIAKGEWEAPEYPAYPV